jgi:CubicO group peptidase (beta-lactamase class C family)
VNKKRTVIVFLLVMIAVVSVATTAVEDVRAGHEPAQSQPVKLGDAGSVAALPSQGPTDPAELETFLDGLMATELEESHIPGAAVAVVLDGEVLLAKGYGYADLEKGIPVDPELTVFRIGSSGKVFTWTAVMQLVEQGKLDLTADINTYLDFRIPDSYPQPITFEHLLTHTAGFEESWFETFTLDPDDVLPAGEWLATHIPARVRPPGDSAAYSNYGAELAGYIVARVSGQPYDEYVKAQILDPLGMVHSSATGRMPADSRAHASVGYFYVDGAFEAVPSEADYSGQLAMVPAGGHASSITDMARFLIAHLQDGRYSDGAAGEVRILKEGTAPQMHSTLYAPDPRLLGTAYGLFDFTDNGQRTLGHNGATLGFRSLLLLIPEQNLGVFVAYNSETAGGLESQHLGFQRAFFDHYYPASAVEPIQPPADFAERAGRFEGSYQLTQMSYTTLEKFMEFFGGAVMRVSNPGDGTLLLTTPWGEWRFVEVEPLYFRQVDADFSIAFREDGQGRITHLFTDLAPMYTFEKLAWYETSAFNMALIAACLLIFLSMLATASIGAIRSRLRGEPKPEPAGARAARRILLGISALNVLFVGGALLWNNPKPMFGVSTPFQIVLGLGVLSAAMTIGVLAYTVLAWKNSYWSSAGRAYYTLVTVAAVAFVWFLNYWNLLGWRF